MIFNGYDTHDISIEIGLIYMRKKLLRLGTTVQSGKKCHLLWSHRLELKLHFPPPQGVVVLLTYCDLYLYDSSLRNMRKTAHPLIPPPPAHILAANKKSDGAAVGK